MEKLFVSGENTVLPRQYSVCIGLHIKFTSHRHVSLFSPASAVTVCLAASQKPLSPCTHTSSEKGGSPQGPAALARHRHGQVPRQPTRADVQMTWSAVVGWASVETSFPHYSQFPFASHRGFELFLPIAPKRRLLAVVSACSLFHDVSLSA